MSKQTVEQAAKLHIGFPCDPLIAISAYEKGFIDGSTFGSEWRSQQGIEWVSVETGLPPTFQKVLCATKKGMFVLSSVHSGGELDTYFIDEDDCFTHYALLNLPKL